jgi:predicted CoA-binding protein
MPSQASIDRFLSGERLAFIGVSRDPKAFANSVYRAFRERGYTVFPVHPRVDEVEGDGCVRSIADLPDVDGAIVMVPAAAAATVVGECADRGIAIVWLHRGVGPGSVTPEAVEVARSRGLDVVDGACPLMFLPSAGWIHRLHRAISGRRIVTVDEAA